MQIYRWWQTVAVVCFVCLCLRFEIAATCTTGGDFLCATILIVGGLMLGGWNTSASLFAFTLSAPLVNGLSQDSFFACSYSLSLVFTAICLGIFLRENIQWLMHSRRERIGSLQRHFHKEADCRELAGDADHTQIDTKAEMSRIAESKKLEFGRLPSFVAEFLIAAVIISLGIQFWRHRAFDDFWTRTLKQPTFGYGDEWYFLTSAFTWLQGLYFFKILSLGFLCKRDKLGKNLAEVSELSLWVRPVIYTYAATTLLFFAIQYFANIPEGWSYFGFQTAFEDISSSGSFAAGLFIFSVATFTPRPWIRCFLGLLFCGCSLSMLILSWSRGAWLAGGIFFLITACIRLPRKFSGALILVYAILLFGINGLAERPFVADQPYLARLSRLLRLESLTKREPERINLYKKAERIILDRPLAGGGIGSFYLDSVKYSDPTDPFAKKPDFAHNVYLQLATELGVPVALLFGVFTCWAICLGLQSSMRKRHSVANLPDERLRELGVVLTLGAYLESQMTANSLNVYLSNQILFWFLVAVICATQQSGECTLSN